MVQQRGDTKTAVEGITCPDPTHAGSRVNAYGVRAGKTRTTRRYRCTPTAGTTHYFSVVTDNGQLPDSVVVSRPPICPDHKGSKVLRFGMYPDKNKAEALGVKRRQRYNCVPADGTKPHTFTPALPRQAVDYGHEHCSNCHELTGIHHGAEAAGRKQQALLEVVVSALEQVALGQPYTRVSRQARIRLGNYQQRRKPAKPVNGNRKNNRTHDETLTPKRVSRSAKEGKRHWHLAADWTEIYAPTLWSHVEGQIRAQEATQMRQPDPERPSVLIIDATPFKTKKGTSSSRGAWSLLAAAQVVWDENTAEANGTRLRQLRAFPVETGLSWRLFFDELSPYEPEYVVADAGSAQLEAVKAIYPNTVLIPSLYHLLENLNKDLRAQRKLFERNDEAVLVLKPNIQRHLRRMRGQDLSAMTMTTWDAWWAQLASLIDGHGANPEAVNKRHTKLHDSMSEVLPHLNKLPQLPLSTGGLETLLANRVKPLLAGRAHGFGNIERTNSLLDLVVCHDRGLFDNRDTVVELLKQDNELHYGWSRPPRRIADAMAIDPTTEELIPVASLSDLSGMYSLAVKKGLV